MPLWNFLDDLTDVLDEVEDQLDDKLDIQVDLEKFFIAKLKDVLGGDEYGKDRTLNGTNRVDFLSGKGGDDTINGKSGQDLLLGWDGNDRLNGDDGSDRLYGGKGDDALYGGSDKDYLDGDKGDDVLFGGTGPDTLYGGAGEDVLVGGNPIVRGGVIVGGTTDRKADRFIFDDGDGNDTIYGFTVGGSAHDVIDLTKISGLHDVDDIKIEAYLPAKGENTLITLPSEPNGPYNTILLVGVDYDAFKDVAADHILF